jgi:hypothetical protein
MKVQSRSSSSKPFTRADPIADGDLGLLPQRKSLRESRWPRAKSYDLRQRRVTRAAGIRGRRDEARSTLSETYNRFTEGFDTADLREAKALLDKLSE